MTGTRALRAPPRDRTAAALAKAEAALTAIRNGTHDRIPHPNKPTLPQCLHAVFLGRSCGECMRVFADRALADIAELRRER